jgi:hypothetical protein
MKITRLLHLKMEKVVERIALEFSLVHDVKIQGYPLSMN